MVGHHDIPPKLWHFLDRVHEVLDQSCFYYASFPSPPDQERVTECLDLLHLLAEFTGDVQKMALACSAFVVEAHGLGLSADDLRRLVGTDLGKLALAYTALATDLSSAGNRAIDIIGETKAHGT